MFRGKTIKHSLRLLSIGITMLFPAISLADLVAPTDTAFVNTPNVQLDWEDEPLVTSDGYVISVSKDNAFPSAPDTITFRQSTIATGYTATKARLSTLPMTPNGTGTFYRKISLADGSGNPLAGTDSITRSFSIDTTAPDQVTVLSPTALATIGTDTVTLERQIPYDDFLGVDYYEYQLVDLSGNMTTGTTTQTNISTNTLSDDTYTRTIRAVDKAGNQGSQSTAQSFVLSKVGLSTNINPINNTLSASGNIDLERSANLQAGSYNYEVSADNFVTTIASGNVVGTGISLMLPDETYSRKVQGMGFLAQTGDRNASTSFTIDTTPPSTPTVSSPANGGIIYTSTITIQGTGEVGAAIQITGHIQGYTTTVDGAGNRSVTIGALANGTYSISIIITDIAGNMTIKPYSFAIQKPNGGTSTILAQDSCPQGDTSVSYYDSTCGTAGTTNPPHQNTGSGTQGNTGSGTQGNTGGTIPGNTINNNTQNQNTQNIRSENAATEVDGIYAYGYRMGMIKEQSMDDADLMQTMTQKELATMLETFAKKNLGKTIKLKTTQPNKIVTRQQSTILITKMMGVQVQDQITFLADMGAIIFVTDPAFIESKAWIILMLQRLGAGT